jgi:hypothetical protein
MMLSGSLGCLLRQTNYDDYAHLQWLIAKVYGHQVRQGMPQKIQLSPPSKPLSTIGSAYI